MPVREQANITQWIRTCAAALALYAIAGCHGPATSADPCAPPPPWNPPGATRGQPDHEFSACLRDKAYDIRNLAIPIESAAPGIIAQCRVEVDRFEGQIADERGAAEQDAERLATAAVGDYRRCVGS